MSDTFKISIFTPAGLQYQGKTSAVSLQTSLGQITILPKHCAYTAQLGAGVISCESSGKPFKAVACGGFCNFDGENLNILTDSLDYFDKVDQSALTNLINQEEAKLLSIDFNKPESQDTLEKIAKLKALQG